MPLQYTAYLPGLRLVSFHVQQGYPTPGPVGTQLMPVGCMGTLSSYQPMAVNAHNSPCRLSVPALVGAEQQLLLIHVVAESYRPVCHCLLTSMQRCSVARCAVHSHWYAHHVRACDSCFCCLSSFPCSSKPSSCSCHTQASHSTRFVPRTPTCPPRLRPSPCRQAATPCLSLPSQMSSHTQVTGLCAQSS